jgi:hypothetical protein
VAPGHLERRKQGFPGGIVGRTDLETLGLASALGVAEGLELADVTDPDRMLLVEALVSAAVKVDQEKDERLANLIINKLAKATEKR